MARCTSNQYLRSLMNAATVRVTCAPQTTTASMPRITLKNKRAFKALTRQQLLAMDVLGTVPGTLYKNGLTCVDHGDTLDFGSVRISDRG